MRIKIKNWGPVREFEYDLSKSVIVTYGDNNIGKSYAMQVVYLLLKHLVAYARRTARFSSSSYYFLKDVEKGQALEVQMVVNFAMNKEIQIEDISEKLEDICAGKLMQRLLPEMIDSLSNTFGTYETMVEQDPTIEVTIDNKLKCMLLFRQEKIELQLDRKPTRLRKSLSEFHKSRNGKEQLDIYVYQNHVNVPVELVVQEIASMQREFSIEILRWAKNVYFLPASRSGIYAGMSSFGPILAQLSQNRPYIKGTIQIPSISEPISDYYMMLSEIRGDMQGHFPEYAEEIEKKFVLYILELRGVKRTCSSKEIQGKFETVINRFMQEEFGHIFLKDSFKYKEVFLYLVTTSYQRAVQLGKFEEYQALRARLNAKDSLANDSTLTTKPYKFRGKYYFIRREVPPNPLIRAIH